MEIRGTFWSWWNSWRNLTPQTTLRCYLPLSCLTKWDDNCLYSRRAEKIKNVRWRSKGWPRRAARCMCAVEEHFTELSNITSFNADSTITEAVEPVLTLKGLNDLLCVAQTYDGASVMKGAVGGVSVRSTPKQFMYIVIPMNWIWYFVTLVVLCQRQTSFLQTLGNVYSFFSVSVVNHQGFHDTQTQLGLGNSAFVQLCKTRWGCQLNSVQTVLENLTALSCHVHFSCTVVKIIRRD